MRRSSFRGKGRPVEHGPLGVLLSEGWALDGALNSYLRIAPYDTLSLSLEYSSSIRHSTPVPPSRERNPWVKPLGAKNKCLLSADNSNTTHFPNCGELSLVDDSVRRAWNVH